ncbi:MAG: ATP-binding protein [Clostridia bacterium]|nr:ATP-binding protein [Clostridia bacterium]
MVQHRENFMIRKLFQNAVLTMLIAELSNALAACGIGAPYYSLVSIVSGILMVGATSLCTRAISKGDTAETTRVFSLSMTLGATLSILIALSGVFFSGGYASLFGAHDTSSQLHAVTSDYLKGTFIGAPGFILYVILIPFLQLDGDFFRPKLASAVLAVVDITGDLLNVLVFRGGMFGMGLSSSISQYAALAVVLTHFIKKSDLFRFSLLKVRLRMTFTLMRDGLPRAVCMLCRGLLPILLNGIAIKLAGDSGVAAYSALTSTTFIVASLGWGIGGAVFMMGGMSYGEQDPENLKNVVSTATRDIFTFVVPLAAVTFAVSPLIAGFFLPEDKGACDMACSAIRCYAISLPFLAFNVSAANYHQAIGRRRGANIINIFIEFACTAAMALILQLFFGVKGIWYAFPAGAALLCVGIILRAVIGRNKNKRGLDAYMLLPPDFGVPDEDCIERSLHSIDEVVTLSEEVVGFCAAHDIPSKDANRLALCIEEMAGNVIEHGFSDGKPHHLEVRVLVKDQHIILRLRDDCVRFDLREQAEKWSFDPEHPERNIGIRMVMHAAKDITYTNSMKTNNLIVTISGEEKKNAAE